MDFPKSHNFFLFFAFKNIQSIEKIEPNSFWNIYLPAAPHFLPARLFLKIFLFVPEGISRPDVHGDPEKIWTYLH
jgi:hypothetical protein